VSGDGTPPALNRFNAPRPGSYAEVTGRQPSRPQLTESATERTLIVHYRRIVGQESQSVAALYAELAELRADPKVARYLEALREHDEASERREQAARDLGMVICRELGEVKQ
jgi:hypothetical protein